MKFHNICTSLGIHSRKKKGKIVPQLSFEYMYDTRVCILENIQDKNVSFFIKIFFKMSIKRILHNMGFKDKF